MRLILLGAGGHGRVVLDAARTLTDVEVVGFLDADRNRAAVDGTPIIGTDEDLAGMARNGVTHAVVSVGSVRPSPMRSKIFERIRRAGLLPATIVHARAVVSASARIGEGSVVLAGAVVNPGAVIGLNCIINTGAIVEHECVIGDHVHISPGAVLGGGVNVGGAAHVGIGATILQGRVVGARALVGAGAVVVRDVPADVIVVGVPARLQRV